MIIVIILIVAVVFVVLGYNSLIQKRNMVNDAFSSIDAELKKRFDLIPNIVSSVSSYMKHEAGLFEKITALRARALFSKNADETIAYDTETSSLLKQIVVSVENYPQLKANENFLHLQGTLNNLEEKISAARRAYNAAVYALNNAIQMFPTNILASLMKLTARKFFEVSEAEKNNVMVDTLFK